MPGPPAPAGLWAFTGPWDARSDSSLRRAAPHLDAAVTGWIALDSGDGTPRLLHPDRTRSWTSPAPRRLALVTSWMGDRFHPGTIRRLGDDATGRTSAAAQVERLVATGRYRGVVLDFEDLAADDSSALTAVVEAVAARVHARGGAVALAVPAGEAPAHRAARVLAAVDRVVVMFYDEHWAGSAPGAVASPAWVSERLRTWLGVVDAGRLVAALPSYGYYWRNAGPGEVLGHEEFVKLAADAGAAIERDPSSRSARVTVPGAGEAWYADAEAVSALAAVAKGLGVPTIALWRLGLDDPALWPERR